MLLTAGKDELLAALRRDAAVVGLLDLGAVADAIRGAPEGDDAMRLARSLNHGHGPPAELRRALDALRVLILARHLD